MGRVTEFQSAESELLLFQQAILVKCLVNLPHLCSLLLDLQHITSPPLPSMDFTMLRLASDLSGHSAM
jgi:hypothetical protein